MTHFPVSGSYRLGGREMRRGRGTGSGASGGGVGGALRSLHRDLLVAGGPGTVRRGLDC